MDCSTKIDPCAISAKRSSPAGSDDPAAREAAAAAEADRVERERLAEEQRQDQRKKDAEFIRNRDAAASTLKGGIGTSASPNNGGLKGGSATLDTGLKELAASERDSHVQATGPQAAWKQLHCAAALSGYAMAALSTPKQGKPDFQVPDYQEFSFLANQASDALNGQALRVECPVAPPLPDWHGRASDMDRVKDAERKTLARAVAIAGRMKERGDRFTVPPPPAPTAPVSSAAGETARETPAERTRRVQRELNQANSQKVTGTTQQDIDRQERDRKELGKLILANEVRAPATCAVFTR